MDRPFHYNVMNSLEELYNLNPEDIIISSAKPEENLFSLIGSVIVDKALLTSFLLKAWKLNTDEMNDDLKESLLEAIGRYYDGDVTQYMNGSIIYSDFDKDTDLVIEY